MPPVARNGASTARHETAASDEHALTRFLWNSVTEYAIFTITNDGTIATWNPGAERTFGYARSEALRRNFAFIFTAEDVAAGVPANELRDAVADGRMDRDCWHVRKDGSRFWGTNTVQPLTDSTGRQMGFTKIVRDSTERYEAALALRQSEERFRLLVDSVDTHAIFSTAPDGRITVWNAGAQRTFGYLPDEILGEHFGKLFTEQDVHRGIPSVELRQARARGQVENERWQVRKNGTRFIAQRRLSLLNSDPAAEAQGFAVVAHDVTERRATEQVMWDQAFHDPLTGLANRALLVEHLRNAIARAKRRPQRPFAALFLDLDDFKTVNDGIGHILADGLLTKVAQRLKTCVRPEDVVGRIGGDEFTILMNEVSGALDAVALAERVHGALALPFTVEGIEVTVGASIGIALGVPTIGATAEGILRDADVAMYEAKARGRTQTVVFDDDMRARVISRHRLEIDIRGALERDEFFLEYQPIVALDDLHLVGFEALVRWKHPLRGVLAPADFIPTAEQNGSIIPIDHWVLGEACRTVRAWQLAFPRTEPLTMSVNLSPKEFMNDELLPRIERTLDETRIDPSSLKLEITEHVIMEKSDKVLKLLAAIRALDVEVQIDDFGTGYSSLSYLRMFPVSAVKVDRSFITGIDVHADRVQIVRTIITLAHDLHLSVIAEGVETQDELLTLRGFGCEYAQGFLFSEALGADAAAAFIATAR